MTSRAQVQRDAARILHARTVSPNSVPINMELINDIADLVDMNREGFKGRAPMLPQPKYDREASVREEYDSVVNAVTLYLLKHYDAIDAARSPFNDGASEAIASEGIGGPTGGKSEKSPAGEGLTVYLRQTVATAYGGLKATVHIVYIIGQAVVLSLGVLAQSTLLVTNARAGTLGNMVPETTSAKVKVVVAVAGFVPWGAMVPYIEFSDETKAVLLATSSVRQTVAGAVSYTRDAMILYNPHFSAVSRYLAALGVAHRLMEHPDLIYWETEYPTDKRQQMQYLTDLVIDVGRNVITAHQMRQSYLRVFGDTFRGDSFTDRKLIETDEPMVDASNVLPAQDQPSSMGAEMSDLVVPLASEGPIDLFTVSSEDIRQYLEIQSKVVSQLPQGRMSPILSGALISVVENDAVTYRLSSPELHNPMTAYTIDPPVYQEAPVMTPIINKLMDAREAQVKALEEEEEGVYGEPEPQGEEKEDEEGEDPEPNDPFRSPYTNLEKIWQDAFEKIELEYGIDLQGTFAAAKRLSVGGVSLLHHLSKVGYKAYVGPEVDRFVRNMETAWNAMTDVETYIYSYDNVVKPAFDTTFKAATTMYDYVKTPDWVTLTDEQKDLDLDYILSDNHDTFFKGIGDLYRWSLTEPPGTSLDMAGVETPLTPAVQAKGVLATLAQEGLINTNLEPTPSKATISDIEFVQAVIGGGDESVTVSSVKTAALKVAAEQWVESASELDTAVMTVHDGRMYGHHHYGVITDQGPPLPPPLPVFGPVYLPLQGPVYDDNRQWGTVVMSAKDGTSDGVRDFGYITDQGPPLPPPLPVLGPENLEMYGPANMELQGPVYDDYQLWSTADGTVMETKPVTTIEAIPDGEPDKMNVAYEPSDVTRYYPKIDNSVEDTRSFEEKAKINLAIFLPQAGTAIFDEQSSIDSDRLKCANLLIGQLPDRPTGTVFSNPLLYGNMVSKGVRYSGTLDATPTYYMGGSLTEGDKLYGTVRDRMPDARVVLSKDHRVYQ